MHLQFPFDQGLYCLEIHWALGNGTTEQFGGRVISVFVQLHQRRLSRLAYNTEARVSLHRDRNTGTAQRAILVAMPPPEVVQCLEDTRERADVPPLPAETAPTTAGYMASSLSNSALVMLSGEGMGGEGAMVASVSVLFHASNRDKDGFS
jgi:hypothetical protein